MKRKVNLNVYAQMVKEYSCRKLSYPTDIENAFGGISKIVDLLFGASEVLFGVPIARLALGLLWTSRGVLTRRSPSAKKRELLQMYPKTDVEMARIMKLRMSLSMTLRTRINVPSPN
jgi:hypothetical protein